MTTYARHFRARKNGRPLAARSVEPFVLCSISSAVSGGIFYACPSTGSYSRGTSLAALATEATSDARSGCRCASSCQIPVYLAAGRDPQGLPITICNKPGEQPGERGASGVFGLKGVGDVVGRLGAADRAGLVRHLRKRIYEMKAAQ